MRQAIVVLLLVAGVAIAAPAPLPKRGLQQKYSNIPAPGEYLVTWGTSEDKPGELLPGGQGWYIYVSTKYFFIWEWDCETRCLTMWEASVGNQGHKRMVTKDYRGMNRYQFVLDEDLKTNGGDYRLHLKRIP